VWGFKSLLVHRAAPLRLINGRLFVALE
jgi:hypothetical protein